MEVRLQATVQKVVGSVSKCLWCCIFLKQHHRIGVIKV
jgi:hypothetical protein